MKVQIEHDLEVAHKALQITQRQLDEARAELQRHKYLADTVRQWQANEAEWLRHAIHGSADGDPCEHCDRLATNASNIQDSLVMAISEIDAKPKQDVPYGDPNHRHRWAPSKIHAAFGCIDCEASYFDWSQKEIAGLRAGLEIIHANNVEIIEHMQRFSEQVGKA